MRQPTLQPGATGAQLDASRPHRRYLAWNDHGILKHFPPRHGGAGPGQVIVEYSRDRGRAGVREVRAPMGLAMGALGPGVFALAANPQGASASPRLWVHAASPLFKATSFEHALPEGEVVEAVALGRHFVAAFTSPLRVLRVHALTGIPLGTIACAGSVVCLVAHEDLLLAITRSPGTEENAEPALEFALYGVAARERLAVGAVPLSPGSSLRWAGISTEALPVTLDSAGVLRALALSGVSGPTIAPAAGEWVPVAELEERGAQLWPVRAERDALACAEVKPGGEPTFMNAKVRSVKFRLPFGADAEAPECVMRHSFLGAHMRFAGEVGLICSRKRKAAWLRGGRNVKPRDGETRQAMKCFDNLVRANQLEQAYEVARCGFFGQAASDEQLVQWIEEAKQAAGDSDREPLATKLAELLDARQPQLSANDLSQDAEEGGDPAEQSTQPQAL